MSDTRPPADALVFLCDCGPIIRDLMDLDTLATEVAAMPGVAKVERDQTADYAARKGMALEEVERWLGPILNYEPATLEAAE